MTSILIAYDSTEGQTRRIAQHVADTVSSRGHDVHMHDIGRLPAGFSSDGFDAVIVGASIHMGKHSHHLPAFVAEHKPRLAKMRSAFFSVSLSAAGSEDERRRAKQYVGEFLEQSDWQPHATATFAGGLRYREYGFFKRWMMKKIARDTGKDTDTSINHEYTNWDEVDEFAREFLSRLNMGG